MSVQTSDVEFVGGPFDGHRMVVPAGPEQLAPVTAIPVNRNVVLRLTGAKKGPQEPAVSVAVYERDPNAWPLRYRHVGRMPVENTPFRDWEG